MIHKSSAFICAVSVISSVCFAAETTATLSNDSKTTLSDRTKWKEFDSFFPLMAWDDVYSEDTIRKMAGCGINSIAFVPPEWLDACAKYNVKAIVYDSRVTPNWDKAFDSKKAAEVLPELVEKYNNHPAGKWLRNQQLSLFPD